MKHLIIFFLALICLFTLSLHAAEKKIYPNRWFYIYRSLEDDQDVKDIEEIYKIASDHGLIGMLLSTGFDRIPIASSYYFARLKKVKAICEKYEIEIIPRCLDVGYNGFLLMQNKNLAAGTPVKDALFVVSGGEARLEADPPVGISNGGFEDYSKNKVPGFSFPGKRNESFKHFTGLGYRVIASGSCNVENFRTWLEPLDATPGGYGIMFTTWRSEYDLLADFGDLVSKRE